jgi:hypothetical protein
MLKFKKSVISSIVLSSALFVSSAQALKIELNQVDPSKFTDSKGQAALAGFNEAATFWENTLADNITLNFDIAFDQLDPFVLGGTRSTNALYYYQNTLVSMIDDIKSDADLIAVSNLPCEDQGVGACAFSFLDTEDDGAGVRTLELDSDGSGDNFLVGLTQANAKALGFTKDDTGRAFGGSSDANITFSSEYDFDFDRTDGITSGFFDFVGVAIHEIGHALGFTSGVDVYDYYLGSGFDLDPYVNGSILDLFRYSADSLAAGAGVLDFRPGADAFFSIDGGITAIAPFSTGANNGDGRQASHWKDNLGLGALDPTAARGEFVTVSQLDLLAFDVMGWDIKEVPAPGALVILLAGSAFMFRRRKN